MGQTTSDPFAVLGVPRNATQEQVRRAYRRLARRHHPDLHPDASSEQMRRINQAWRTLSSPARRARYSAPTQPRSRGSGPWPESAWASPRARTYRQPAAGLREDGPGLRSVVGAAAMGLLLFLALFVGILPGPLFGIVLLVAARSISGRFVA